MPGYGYNKTDKKRQTFYPLIGVVVETKIESGCYTPWEDINAMSQIIGNNSNVQGEADFSDFSKYSETDYIHARCP